MLFFLILDKQIKQLTINSNIDEIIDSDYFKVGHRV